MVIQLEGNNLNREYGKSSGEINSWILCSLTECNWFHHRWSRRLFIQLVRECVKEPEDESQNFTLNKWKNEMLITKTRGTVGGIGLQEKS